MVKKYICSPVVDGCFILAPAFVITALVFILPGVFQAAEVPVWAFVVFVLGIDVAHVYGTLFRTYFNREIFKRRERLLLVCPLLCWIGGVFLFSVGASAFWKGMAYLAVFHFVRQQYGFVRLYSRGEPESVLQKMVRAAAVYMAAIYPLIYWHTHLPRNFAWFMQGDFFGLPGWVHDLALALYVAAMGAWIVIESLSFNAPRALIILGTAVSWMVGIVIFDNDMVFTVTNVVAHGVPYIALSFYRWEGSFRDRVARLGPVVFFAGVLAFAYLEEGLWDGLIWSDHSAIFPIFSRLGQISDGATLTWLVPLLALPQATHYILDGFIWKRDFV